MTDTDTTTFEFLHVVEGERKPRLTPIGRHETVQAVLKRVGAELGRDELIELFFEEEERAIAAEAILFDLVANDTRVLNMAGRGHIEVAVGYNGRTVRRPFRPNATIAAVTKWAISPEALDLQGVPTDFQLKLGTEVLPPDPHLGQVSRCGRELHLTLVFKIKPQG